MAAYRKKYASLEADEPVTTVPAGTAAHLPPATSSPPKLDEPPKESDPVGQAAKSAIEQRLAEMERANQSAPRQEPQQPPQADDPDEQEQLRQFREQLEQVIAPLPNEAAKHFFRMHPELLFDEEQKARANHYHYVTMREVGEPYTPQWLERMKYHLGIDQPKPEPPPQRQASASSRPVGPSVPYSAPPTRDSPSMTTGRPVVSDSRVTLTVEERSLAKSLGISDAEYARQKQRLMREKDAGMHQHGG